MGRLLRVVLAGVGCAVILGWACASDEDPLRYKRVVFVGASITEGWDFQRYFAGYDFRKVINYDVDKTAVWDQVEALDADVVVVKECAAYFNAGGGTPLSEYYRIMERMAALIDRSHAIPVFATTVPVDVGFGGCTQAQLNDIRTFNSWVKNYCNTHGLVCLDLYAAVADNDGQLPTDCHNGDGLHPNRRGYDKLSPAVIPALERAI